MDNPSKKEHVTPRLRQVWKTAEFDDIRELVSFLNDNQIIDFRSYHDDFFYGILYSVIQTASEYIESTGIDNTRMVKEIIREEVPFVAFSNEEIAAGKMEEVLGEKLAKKLKGSFKEGKALMND